MKVEETDIADVKVLMPRIFEDHRGTFTKLFGSPALHEIMGNRTIRQVNRSITSKAGMIRGLHYQNPPFAEMKIITCLRGKVWDLAVDLRKGSPDFLKWTAVELSEDNHRMIVIPEGFAHGFQALAPDSEMVYFCTADYVTASESGVRFDTPLLNIKWPMAPEGLSERDYSMPFLSDDFAGISL